MPHSGSLVQREPGGRCLLTGSNWSKLLLPWGGPEPCPAKAVGEVSQYLVTTGYRRPHSHTRSVPKAKG